MALSLGAISTSASRLLRRLHWALTNDASDITTAATGDIVLMLDASDNYEPKYADADNVKEMLGLDVAALVETVTATNVLTAAETGKTMFLSAAAGFLTTFPTPAAGLRYKFIVKTAPTSNGYTFTPSGGTADIIVVSVNELETDTTEDGPWDDNADLVTLVANVSVQGDFLDVYCDGTKWYMIGQTNADGAVTTATT